MAYNKEQHARKRSLRYSTGEGAFMAASNTITETFTIPYALTLKANNFEIGLLNSLKSMADIASQLPGSKITEYFNRKNICLASMLLTKLLWLPIIVLPLFFGNAILILISLLTLSIFFQSLRRPAWTSIIGDLVKEEERGRYFASRNAITGFTSLLATVAAGFLLSAIGFSLLFVISVMLGLAAFFLFMQVNEPYFKRAFYYKHTFNFKPKDMINFFRVNRNFTTFTLYMSFLSFATDIAAPFIVVYILKDLSISYELFAIAVAAGMLARIASQRYWGYFNDKYGSRKVLGICGVLVAFVPFLYIFSSNVYHILFVRIFDGIVWAGMDLAAFNFLLGTTPSQQRPSFVANHNIFTGAGSMIGALIGGLMAELFSATTGALSAIQLLFVISLVLRTAALLFLRFVKDTEYRPVKSKYIMLNPLSTEVHKVVHHAKEVGMHSTYRAINIAEWLDESLKEGKYKHNMERKKNKGYFNKQ